MTWPGRPIGVPSSMAPVIDEQCPAVTTIVGVTSVPEHRKAWPMSMEVTYGYLPAGASVPPTTAWADEAGGGAEGHLGRGGWKDKGDPNPPPPPFFAPLRPRSH